jgi:hypothetical protein
VTSDASPFRGPDSSAVSSPFRGLDSYQTEDTDLFFGRESETEQLTSRILSSKFTLLYAPSGAGKTSLINARVIPELEQKGWAVVRTRVGDDPMSAIRRATLDVLFVPPEAEIAALDRAAIRLFGDGNPEASLDQLIERFDAQDIPTRKELVRPVHYQRNSATDGQTVPQFCRLLRGGLSLEAFFERLALLNPSANSLDSATPLATLKQLFASTGNAYDNVLEGMRSTGDDELLDFFQRLFGLHEHNRASLSLVVILDQFEELFTHFSRSRTHLAIPGLGGDPKLRWELFRQLAAVYEHSLLGLKDAQSQAKSLTIRFVVSLRQEFLAELDPIRNFASDLDQRAFHLNWLSKKGAGDAIVEPAKIYDTDTAWVSTRVVSDLTMDEKFVHPAMLQIVCEKLWAEVDWSAPKTEQAAILDALGGVDGIVRSFLDSFLRDIERETPGARREATEILSHLITGVRTRNILEHERLERCEEARILRSERRGGVRFVEIMHEFLVEAILKEAALLKQNVEWKVFFNALEALILSGRAGTKLFADDFGVLHRNREDVEWTGSVGGVPATRIMLESILELPEDGPLPVEELLETWLGRFEETGQTLRPADIPDAEPFRQLDTYRLRAVNENRNRWHLGAGQIETVFRSTVLGARDDQVDDVEFWTRRLVDAGTRRAGGSAKAGIPCGSEFEHSLVSESEDR